MYVPDVSTRTTFHNDTVDETEVGSGSTTNNTKETEEVEGNKGVGETKETQGTKGTNEAQSSTGQRRSVGDDLKNNPQLPAPSEAFKPFETKLTLEALIELVSDENKTLSSDGAKKALSATSNERAVQNEKRLEELNTQIEKLEEQEKMSQIQKTMNKVMAFFQLLGAIFTIAVAIVCPNPATIIGAVATTISAIDNALNAFSDGKISMSAGFEALDKACGGDGSFAQAMNIFVTVNLMAAQIFAAVTNPGESLSAAAKIINMVNDFVQAGATLANGTVNFVVNVNNALLQYDIQDSQARQTMIQALLAQLDNSQERELEEVKEILKHGQDLANGLEEVLDSLNAGLKSAATSSV